MNKRRWSLLLVLALILSLGLIACTPDNAAPVTEEEPAAADSGSDDATDAVDEQITDDTGEVDDAAEDAADTAAEDELPTLRIALLPVLDVLPFFIAQDAGYFAEEGVSVELIPVGSPIEREELISAGEVDGVLNDVIGVAIRNAIEPTQTIVAKAREAVEDGPLFRILASPESSIETAEDLAGVAIGISENSIIEYLSDRLLEQAGLAGDDIAYQPVPVISERFTLLMSGELQAAMLPDPLAQSAVEEGAALILEDTTLIEEGFSQSVLVFNTTAVEENGDAVAAVVRAWFRAVEDLNNAPEDYRQLWLDNTNVPPNVQDSYEIPPFPVNEITSQSEWDDVNAWLLEQEIIEEAPAYAESVTTDLLPE